MNRHMMKTLILAALPQEYGPLKKLIALRRVPAAWPFKTFACSFAEKEIMLIETGMGNHCAEKALHAALARCRPDLLLFAGFAGGLHPALSVGDVCVARSCLAAGLERNSGASGFEIFLPPEMVEFAQKFGVRPVCTLGVAEPAEKKALAALAPGRLAVVDMETSAVARIAWRESLPLACFRAISDALDDDLGFELAAITGRAGKVDGAKVLRTILDRPPVMRAFYRSWRRSALAGKNLCAVLASFLSIPAPGFGAIARGIRVERP